MTSVRVLPLARSLATAATRAVGLTALVLALAGPDPAAAAVVYASPTGSGSNPGTLQAPWSLDNANYSLVGGDVCILLPGTYPTMINPRNSGTGAGNRITYVGSITNPGSTTAPGISLTKAWITVKGINSTADIALDYPARYDSVAWCIAEGGHFYGAKYSMIARNVINGHFEMALENSQTLHGISNAEYDTLRGNIINIGDITGNWHGFKMRGYTQNCLIDSNRVNGRFVQTGTTDAGGRMFYNSSYNTLRDNSWSFNATSQYNANGDAWNGFVLRDSCNHFLFERDTVLLGLQIPQYPVRGVLCSTGSYGNVRDNTYNQCVLKSNAYFWIQDWFTTSTIQNSLIMSSNDLALWGLNAVDGSHIIHNTFWAPGQVVNFAQPFRTTTEIHSNIFYSQNAGPIGTGGGIIQYAANATSNLAQNYNLYFTKNFTNSPGDRSLEWCCYTGSKPGTGTPWYNLNGQDGNSRHGSPMFVDSSFANFDPRLRSGSFAIGAGMGGTDAGAIPFAPVGPDNTPPAAVTDLAVGQILDHSMVLSWTAPGDNGTSGQAAAYDLRWSTSAISAASFGSATPVSTPPFPMSAGSTQTYVMLNLATTTKYYFALKTRDAAGNWSGVSNLPSGTTQGDITPPAAIKDLRTGP